MHSFIITGTACLFNSLATPISVLRSNFTASIIFPFSSFFASNVPLKSLDIQTENFLYPLSSSLRNIGSADIYFKNETKGPGKPVPVLPLLIEEDEPAISLII